MPHSIFFSRSTKLDFDWSELNSDRWVQAARTGLTVNGYVEHRYVIVLDHHDLTEFTLADPGGSWAHQVHQGQAIPSVDAWGEEGRQVGGDGVVP